MTLTLAVRHYLIPRGKIVTLSYSVGLREVLVSSILPGVNTNEWYLHGWFNYQTSNMKIYELAVVLNDVRMWTSWNGAYIDVTTEIIGNAGEILAEAFEQNKWFFLELG